LAVAVVWGIHELAARLLVPTRFFSLGQVAAGVAAGGVLGLVGSWVAVNRHLRALWRAG
jgi:hypothetical protein